MLYFVKGERKSNANYLISLKLQSTHVVTALHKIYPHQS